MLVVDHRRNVISDHYRWAGLILACPRQAFLNWHVLCGLRIVKARLQLPKSSPREPAVVV